MQCYQGLKCLHPLKKYSGCTLLSFFALQDITSLIHSPGLKAINLFFCIICILLHKNIPLNIEENFLFVVRAMQLYISNVQIVSHARF